MCQLEVRNRRGEKRLNNLEKLFLIYESLKTCVASFIYISNQKTA